jgi:hypothetical protein
MKLEDAERILQETSLSKMSLEDLEMMFRFVKLDPRTQQDLGALNAAGLEHVRAILDLGAVGHFTDQGILRIVEGNLLVGKQIGYDAAKKRGF